MAAHSVDAPHGSSASRSCTIAMDVDSGCSPKPQRGSSDKPRMAITSADIRNVLGGACVGENKANLAAASLGIESGTGSLANLAENQIAPESGQLNSIHNERGGQDDPNVNADTAGQDDPPEATNHQAGDVQIAPTYDTVLQLLVNLPTPKQNWIYPDLETV